MNYKFKTKPWEHQAKAVQIVHDENLNHYGLFFDMGTGKSKTAVDLWRMKSTLHKRPLITLVITPIVVMEQFGLEEFINHSNLKSWQIAVIDGITKVDGKKLKNPSLKLKKEQLAAKNKVVYVVNTDMVANKNLWPLIEKLGIECLIVDESHKFKTFNSTRTKSLTKFVDSQPQLLYRFILTGTPILKNALDLWSQFYIMDKNIFGKNYYTFLHKYFYDKNSGMPSHCHFPDWQPKDAIYYKKYGLPFENINDSLNAIIYKHAMRVMKDECLDLPDFVQQTIPIGMNKELSKIYKSMEKDAIAFLESGVELTETNFSDESLPTNVMVADLAIVKLIRLQQLACGIFTDSEGNITHISSEREKILSEMLEQLTVDQTNKIIVWTSFAPTYEIISDICTDLKLEHRFITGQQTYDEKMQSKDEFNNNPKIRVLIANQGAGGTGVNLTSSNYSIYYSRSFNLEHDLQSEARNYRGGQTRKVTRYDLVCSETIDEKVLLALKSKKKNADDILANREFSSGDIRGILT